jgi:hypothetical protein
MKQDYSTLYRRTGTRRMLYVRMALDLMSITTLCQQFLGVLLKSANVSLKREERKGGRSDELD